tara:strand:+ start:168 stop:1433 length:1266 start_codon:yes stop_codon:yes gene_type:complete
MTIFPIISIGIIAVFTRCLTRSWISPGAFFSLCWSFFLIVPIIFASDYKMDYLGLWFIAIFSMSLATGSIIAYSIKTPIKSEYINNFQIQYNYRLIYYMLIIFCLIIFFGLYLLFQYARSSYNTANYINDWMMIPNLIAADRYTESPLNYPFIIKYSLYLIYPANLLSGLLINQLKGSNKFFSMLPLIAAILLGIIEGARSSILLGLTLFISSWLSVIIMNPTKRNKIKGLYFKFAFTSGSFVLFFTIFFVLIQWLRQGMDTLILDLLIERVRAYFFGYLAAFTQWISNPIELNPNYGLITFAGPFNLFGVMERPLGFYDAINIGDGISTNIFTAFRGIVTDFSVPGAIMIAFAIGFIFQLVVQKNEGTNILGIISISMFYAFTLYSPLISIFHYNSILFSWLILFIILILAKNEPVDNYC